MKNKSYQYGPKIDVILDMISPLEMTHNDFISLTLACADQAGMPISEQEKLYQSLKAITNG